MRFTRFRGPVHQFPRVEKALMIDAVLTAHFGGPVRGRRVLDIGCGNGDISQHFVPANEVHGVDVDDRRRPENAGFAFDRVTSERLPFGDGFFDVVISNHVIEHVVDQPLHLSEMRRVLRADGCVYLATPNRSSPIMAGHVANEQVLRYREMRPLFERMGFRVRDFSVAIVRDTRAFRGDMPDLGWLPAAAVRLLLPWFPSHVFILEPHR
ncbi:MAG: class I SAM-dependent methyltransferase [Gemmatimonadaceae bacterium]